MNKNIYIEFIGMPASGKSHYLKIIKNNLKKIKVTTNNFNELNKITKFFFLILFIIKYLRYSFKILFIFLRLDFKNRETKRHFYYFRNEAPLRLYYKFQNKILINSEGFRYRSVFYINSLRNKMNKNEIKNFIDSLPKVHLLIFVRSNKNLNIKRSKKRKNGYKYTTKDLKVYTKNERIILQICKETRKKALVVEIHKRTEKKDLKKILSIIKNIIEN